MRALIIDDEQHAREELRVLLEETGSFQLLDSCANALEALKVINRDQPELIFLDIEMPALNGFEMLGMLDEEVTPYVVFVTAYDEYALRAFEENTLDYLLKPVDPQRLRKMIVKVRRALQTGQQQDYPLPALTRVPCQWRNRVKLISPDEIDYVFTDVSGVNLVTAAGSLHTELTLRVLEQRTPLIRCHKQYQVSPGQVVEIRMFGNGNAEITTVLGNRLPVSRRYLKIIKRQLDL